MNKRKPYVQKALKFEVKELTENGEFKGYASTRDRDLMGDIVLEGAFKRTIDLNDGVFPVLFFHDPTQPIGLSTLMKEDGHGLYTEGKLNLGKQLGRDVYSDMKMGIIDRMSIGFSMMDWEYDTEKNARLVKEVKLYEYSLITRNFAANPQALLTGVKGACVPDYFTEERAIDDVMEALFRLTMDLKAGRTLKSADRALVEKAVALMGDAGSALEALLEAATKGAGPSPAHPAPTTAAPEPANGTKSTDLDIQSMRQRLADMSKLFA